MRDVRTDSWRVTTFGEVVSRVVNGGTPPTDVKKFWTGNIPWITGADFAANGVGEFRRFVSRDAIAATATNVVNQGELLLVTRTGVGKLAIAPCDIAISQDISGVYADRGQVDTGFFFHRMRQGVEDLRKLNQGTSINGIVRSDLMRYPLELPPLTQQRRISDILSTLDDAIEQTEALIAKTQQIKTGLMRDLFTRGVTPDGQLRPTREQAPQLYKESSLGWIPCEWDVLNLGSLAEIVSGVTLGSDSLSGVEVPYLRVANVQDGYLDLSEMKTVRVDPARLARLVLRPGDVLMNEGGDFDKLGRGTVWSGEIAPCIHQNHVFRVRPNDDCLRSDYLAYWSQSQYGKKYFLRSSKQSTNLASINSTQLHAFPVAIPGRDEQQEVERRIGAVNAQLVQLVHDAAKGRKLRMGLMHDLLTGRVRVAVDTMEPVAAEA